MAVDLKGYFSRDTEALLYLLGYQAQKDSCNIYVVGSFVRDLFLGKESRIMEILVYGEVVPYVQNIHRSLTGEMQYSEPFGTASLHIPGSFKIKLNTLKHDFNFLSDDTNTLQTSLKNELFQRDFTINTLAVDLNPGNFCKLYDFFGGRQDLSEGTIRVLYSLSFVNDPLRLLRALRFEQRFGFTINEDTVNLMRTAIKARVLHKVSREKIGRELRLIFAEAFPSRVLRRLRDLGLWQQVFPRLSYDENIMLRLERLEQMHNSRQLAGNHTFRYNTFVGAISPLFYGLSPHDIQYLGHILRLKRKETQAVIETISLEVQ